MSVSIGEMGFRLVKTGKLENTPVIEFMDLWVI